jgi:nicotinate-nucleotide adenylyltransferase
LKRIGVFGGSFDPPHNAHVALSHAALEHLALDELRWVPAGDAWQKSRRLASAHDREAMVRLAIAGEPRFVLERCELRRAGPSYTIETIDEIQAATPGAQWFLIIGQDQFARLHTWHDWKALLPKVTFAVACRDGDAVQASSEVAARAHAVVGVPLPRIDISSTAIRRAVADGRDFTDMVPAAVASYIDRHRLYKGNTRS